MQKKIIRRVQKQLTKSSKKKTTKKAPKEKPTSYTKSNFSELSVWCVFIVQVRGHAAVTDVAECFKNELNAKVNKNTLRNVLEALRKKDFLRVRYVDGVQHYHVAKLKFNRDLVELPQISLGLLPTLRDDPAGIALISWVEADIAAKKNKSKENNYPTTWCDYEVTFQLLKEWNGSQVLDNNPVLDRLYHLGPFQTMQQWDGNGDSPLVFDRSDEGQLLVHTDCIRGFLQKHLNRAGVNPNKIAYFDLEPIIITDEDVDPGKVILERRPIIRAGQQRENEKGAGFKFYETVPAGTVITWLFSAPTKNFLTPDQMQVWIKRILRRNYRSMSPARGGATGCAKLVGFKHDLWELAADTDAVA